ncbi:MAG TPA: DUF4159 domain-containing protein [Thermodesulfobacteriota bacterium]|nr:DUF4159 domain-containing protein [Thermodesulfobacteriota bacterium]
MITRREILKAALALACGCFHPRRAACAETAYPHFFFTQIRYRGGAWDPNPDFAEAIVEELELRTSIDAARERRMTDLSGTDLFFAPFLYLAGKYEFEPFTPGEREILKRYLTFGGFLFAEDTLALKGSGFDRAFRAEMKKIFPQQDFKRLPLDHPVYQSFYLINQIGGRQIVSPYFEGITVDSWTPVIYSQNDLSGSWSRDKLGRWTHECAPGGEAQRALAFKAGINVIVYSLTSDYKRDLVHHPFIRKRLGP